MAQERLIYNTDEFFDEFIQPGNPGSIIWAGKLYDLIHFRAWGFQTFGRQEHLSGQFESNCVRSVSMGPDRVRGWVYNGNEILRLIIRQTLFNGMYLLNQVLCLMKMS